LSLFEGEKKQDSSGTMLGDVLFRIAGRERNSQIEWVTVLIISCVQGEGFVWVGLGREQRFFVGGKRFGKGLLIVKKTREKNLK